VGLEGEVFYGNYGELHLPPKRRICGRNTPLLVYVIGYRSICPVGRAYRKGEQVEEGLTVLAEAFTHAEKSGEGFYEAEVYRLKGELLLAQEGLRPQAKGSREKTEEAEGCFLRVLSGVYHWFTEGFGTKDLREAQALLAVLA
jgi:hypothetical protein